LGTPRGGQLAAEPVTAGPDDAKHE